MYAILSPKGMCSELRDLFEFREISDDTSEKMHDRDIVAIEDYDETGREYSLASTADLVRL